MATIKCKMCGGDIELSPDKTFGTCEYCGSTMTLPRVDDEQRAALFNRGNHFRRVGDFDKALAIYENIVREDDTDAEAHWCCTLCRFGIEYVEDPTTYEYLPTCHRASFDSILDDVDYKAALEYSDGITRRQYQKDAARIAEVQRGILATVNQEEPFDIFLCYKETDIQTGERSRDSLDAQEIYYRLTEKGYRVFFARITLEDKAGTEYEPYIFAALQSAKVMIVLGEKPEHFNAVWVKNEWSRYLAAMKKDRSRLLIPCYKDMDPYDLPEQLSVLQSYDMSRIGFVQDLIRGVGKVLNVEQPKEAVIQQPVAQTTSGPNIVAQIKRGQQALEDRDWQAADAFFDRALDMDAECAEAFFGKALTVAQCVTGEELIQKRIANAKPEKEILKACERDDARRREAIKQYTLPEYLPEMDVTRCFSYDLRTYASFTKGWQTCIEQEKAYWMKDRNLSRALRYAKGNTAEQYQYFREQILAALEAKRSESAAADEKAKSETIQRYTTEMDKAEQRVKEKYAAATAKREKAFSEYCAMQANAKSVMDYQKVAKCFEAIGMRDYKDSSERAARCRTEIAQQIEREKIVTERREADARAKAEAEAKAKADAEWRQHIAKERAKKNKIRKKAFITIVVFAMLIAAYLIVTRVIIPESKYKDANDLLASGYYNSAFRRFSEIKDYKDSTDIINGILVEHPNLRFVFSSVGDSITYGKYEQDNDLANGSEDIEWLVLSKEANNKLLVISKYALDCRPYNDKYISVFWNSCDIHSWLNGSFLADAFTEYEKETILTVEIDAGINPKYSSTPGNVSNDRMFLLSIEEFNEFLTTNALRKCSPTAYAKANECYVSSTGFCWYWLRTPGERNSYAALVSVEGEIGYGGSTVENKGGTVRPAMWISLK